jgi:HAD superfamily hydrolase (TIGR01484 family)
VSESALLLCTDLDRTLLPNGSQPESPGARGRFAAFVASSAATLVYVTGRDRELVEEAIREFDIPSPHFVVSDVGTTIYDLRSGAWVSVPEWHAAIAADWRGADPATLAEWLRDIPDATLQEDRKQGIFKLRYYLPLDRNWSELEPQFHRLLRANHVRANVIYSVDEVAAIGLIDVLPASAGKLSALEFLSSTLGLDHAHMLFAGDSGNDLAVLVSAIPAVLVANAAPEVAEAARALAARDGTTGALYAARGSFLGMNGNYSAGILEGVAHFHPELFAAHRWA